MDAKFIALEGIGITTNNITFFNLLGTYLVY